jgi:hypothetical protein
MVFAVGFCAVVTLAALYAIVKIYEGSATANQELYAKQVAERDSWAAERLRMMTHFQAREAELLNRIKPETSQYPVVTQEVPVPQTDLDNDEYFAANFPTASQIMNDANQNGLHEESDS